MKLWAKITEAHIWSNLFYLAPAFYALSIGHKIIGILGIGVFIFSALHHLFKKTNKSEWWWKKGTAGTYNPFFSFTDLFFTILLTIATTFLFFHSNYSEFNKLIVFIFVLISIILLSKKFNISYNTQNSLWHLFSATTLLLVLALSNT